MASVSLNHPLKVSSSPEWNALAARLAVARNLHFLGPGDIAGHLEHSMAFARVVTPPRHLAVDLGSGAGVPGLVLACLWPDSRWLLVESNQRRAEFLERSLPPLGLTGRVVVVCARAEVVCRQPVYRATADLAVARGFGPPAVTAECASPLLRSGGILVVAEPPGGRPERWPPSALADLGMVPVGVVADPVAIQLLRQETPCPDRYPRRVGVPAKRPLWVAPGST
ncbi:MAG: 16S rRNA (guanine(527)-N(7))-methyltransferase RsmG [Acidimicrobiales bacterium]